MIKKLIGWVVAVLSMLAAYAAPVGAHTWREAEFANRPLFAYPLPTGRDDIVGTLTTYTIQRGDTLLDVGRWFGLSAKEISDANGHMDWWTPPVDRVVILPTAHILPDTPRSGIILNVPEMRLYYYYPSITYTRHHKGKSRGKTTRAVFSGPRVVYTFPVGLGRFDWKTPVGEWRVIAKIKDPSWTLPDDIYQEHLERDGFADHVVPPGPDNPLGRYKLELSIPQYGLHGTNVPWGIGMTVSHGCVRLFPEDIERLFSKTPVGTPGEFAYQPVKFGWRGDALYVEVHDDLYGRYPGLWRLALTEVKQQKLISNVDLAKLEKAVVLKAGIPTYVGFGSAPPDGSLPETAAAAPPETAGTTTAPETTADNPPPDSNPDAAADNAPAESNADVAADNAPGETAPTPPTTFRAPAVSRTTTTYTTIDSTAPPRSAPPPSIRPSAAGVPPFPPYSATAPMPPSVIAPAAGSGEDPDDRPGGDDWSVGPVRN
ncbi:MAG TPA: L,D-transpeptidase family protein [Candidatus Binataceae bacterium]|nr:L,D-transpeptidase family protein [Candidatus Binataceae bacterium]